MYGGRSALGEVIAAANRHPLVINMKPLPDA
jgi:hypothetical protein